MRKNRRDDSTILLVEDDELNRKLLHQLLQSRGYRVVEAVNGLVALELARRERPALILMDIDLPGLDGIGITRRIREDATLRQSPIFMVTAFDTPEIRAAAFDAGCNEYLVKPLDADKLETLLKSALHEK
jgi:two-component system cell cycle response regulator DivK